MRPLFLALALIAAALSAPLSAQEQVLTLPEAVAQGLNSDPATSAARAAVQSVEANRDEARSAFSPTLSTEASAGVRRLENATRRNLGIANEVLYPFEASLQADYTLFDFGTRNSLVDQQEALVSAAESRVDGEREEAALNIARQYAQVLLQQEVLSASQAFVREYSGLVRELQTSVEEGLVGLPDLQLSEQRLETALARTIEAEQELADARVTLELLLGIPIASKLAPLPDPGPALADGAIGIRAALIATNPAVRASQEEARAASAAAEAARARLKPTIGADANARVGEDIDAFQGYTNDVRGRVYVRWNLFDGGAGRARVDAAEARAVEAQERARQVLRDSEVDALNAYNAFGSLETLTEINRRELAAVRGLSESYRAQFEASRRSILDVFEAQDLTASAVIRYQNTRYARTLAGYRALALEARLVDFLESQ